MEARKLAIYFEEEASDQYKRNKELKSQQASANSRGTRVEEITELELGDDEEEDE